MLLAVLLTLAAHAGLMDAPGGAYQVRYDPMWYPVGPTELALEAEPDACAVELLGSFAFVDQSLAMDLRAYLRDRKAGTETAVETFTALGGREGVVIHTTRMRKLVLQQMSWAAVPLGDGTAALLALRWEGSAQSTARPDFLAIAGTALPEGILEDRPIAQLEEIYRKAVARPDDLVELRGLFYECGALRGEVFNGSERVLNRVVLDVQVRDAEGRASASRLVEVIPGPDRRALGAGASKPFHIDMSGDDGAPAGLGGARIETLEWADQDSAPR